MPCRARYEKQQKSQWLFGLEYAKFLLYGKWNNCPHPHLTVSTIRTSRERPLKKPPHGLTLSFTVFHGRDINSIIHSFSFFVHSFIHSFYQSFVHSLVHSSIPFCSLRLSHLFRFIRYFRSIRSFCLFCSFILYVPFVRSIHSYEPKIWQISVFIQNFLMF